MTKTKILSAGTHGLCIVIFAEAWFVCGITSGGIYFAVEILPTVARFVLKIIPAGTPSEITVPCYTTPTQCQHSALYATPKAQKKKQFWIYCSLMVPLLVLTLSNNMDGVDVALG